MSTTPRTSEQHDACVREFRALMTEDYADGATFRKAIETFIADHGAQGLDGYAKPCVSDLFQLCARTLDYDVPATKAATRNHLLALGKVSKWVEFEVTAEDLAYFLLEIALPGGKGRWAKALLEAKPLLCPRIVNDDPICRNLKLPANDQAGAWQWTMERLTQECLESVGSAGHYSRDAVKNANTLLTLAYLWQGNGEQRTTTSDMADEKVDWMARHRETLGRQDEEIVNRFLAGCRRERLVGLGGEMSAGNTPQARPLRL